MSSESDLPFEIFPRDPVYNGITAEGTWINNEESFFDDFLNDYALAPTQNDGTQNETGFLPEADLRESSISQLADSFQVPTFNTRGLEEPDAVVSPQALERMDLPAVSAVLDSNGFMPQADEFEDPAQTEPIEEGEKEHEKEHESHSCLDHIARQWKGETKCNWRNCSSKAVFPSYRKLEEHVRNIHIEPLLCPVSNCRYTKPFGKKCDLHRHIKTKHGDPPDLECPVPGCQIATKFSRKDKLTRHLRESHLFQCQYNHCGTEVYDHQRALHMDTSHGQLECAIGGCDPANKSCFTAKRLAAHLKKDHGIDGHTARWLMNTAKRGDKITLKSRFWNGSRCKICAKAS